MPTITDADRIFAGNKWIKEVKFNGQVVWEKNLGHGTTVMKNENYDIAAGTGYFGVVSAADFISGDALASELGLTAGTGQNSNAGWLKFYFDTDDIVFVAKKPFRYGIAKTSIPHTTVVIGGVSYSVSTMDGGTLEDFTSPVSEWNRYIYRVWEEIYSCQGDLSNWTDFTNAELGCGTNDLGAKSWCRNTDGGLHIKRGAQGDAGGLSRTTSTSGGVDDGWRPMLTAVQPE